jgi:hypothetical protein
MMTKTIWVAISAAFMLMAIPVFADDSDLYPESSADEIQTQESSTQTEQSVAPLPMSKEEEAIQQAQDQYDEERRNLPDNLTTRDSLRTQYQQHKLQLERDADAGDIVAMQQDTVVLNADKEALEEKKNPL